MVSGQLLSSVVGSQGAVWMDAAEAFIVYLIAAGCLLGAFFSFEQTEQWIINKYTALGQAFSILFLGLSIPSALVQAAIVLRR